MDNPRSVWTHLKCTNIFELEIINFSQCESSEFCGEGSVCVGGGQSNIS